MTGDGTVIATIAGGRRERRGGQREHGLDQHRQHGHLRRDAPTVTINQAAGQADPTNASPINFTVVFSESVTGFAAADVTLAGTAGATTAVVTGGGTTYNVAVSGMTGDGTVIATVAGGRRDAMRRATRTRPRPAPTTRSPTTRRARSVTINQAAGQADPTNASPINFTVVFSESVTGFAGADVTLAGTAGATTATGHRWRHDLQRRGQRDDR